MTTVRIDHLDARYHDVALEDIPRLERALTEVVSDGIDLAVTEADLEGGLLDDSYGSAWAVCLPLVCVDVVLDSSDPGRVISVWSQAVVDAVRRAAHPLAARAADHDARRLVVFSSEADALVDLLRGHATADHRHAWAWRQVGLLPGSRAVPTRTDVLQALLARPRLVPAVLGAVGPALLSALTPHEVLALARAVLADLGGPVPDLVGRLHGGEPAALSALTASAVSPVVSRLESARAAAAGSALPAGVWVAVAAPAERLTLALLALAVTSPARVHDVARAARVAQMSPRPDPPAPEQNGLARPRGTDAKADPTEGAPTVREKRPEHADPSPDRGAGDEDPTAADATDAEAAAEELGDVPSAWGGVWFLTHALAALDLVGVLVQRGVDAHEGLCRVLADVTGAPADDPCVTWLAGEPDRPAQDGRGAEEVPTDVVIELGHEVEAWLENQVARCSPALDPATMWRRPVVLRRGTGLVEVGFALDDVDLAVRRAGLDLDPGWVWWLGAVVRFRYA